MDLDKASVFPWKFFWHSITTSPSVQSLFVSHLVQPMDIALEMVKSLPRITGLFCLVQIINEFEKVKSLIWISHVVIPWASML